MQDPEPTFAPRAQALRTFEPGPQYVPRGPKRGRCKPGMVRASDMFAAMDPASRWAFAQMHPAVAQRLERALLKRLRRGTP